MKYFFTIIALLFFTGLSAQHFNVDALSQRLEHQLESEEGFHHISILLTDRVDVQSLNEDFYRRKVSPQQRSFELITTLQQKASEAQTDILAFLHESPLVIQESIHPYWISNIIFIKAKKELIAELSWRSDVEWMDINAKLEISETTTTIAAPVLPDSIEPGLIAINAHKMWALGYTGYGQVAFVNDTGVDPIHPAYKLKYRGFYVEPGQAWFQYETGNTTPNACGDHGSHVLGTMLGLDRETHDTIGVAFNGLWVGAPILCGIGTEDNIASFEWALDPDEDPMTFEDMPDVINNSWYDPDLNGDDCESLYVPVLNAMEASGIAVVFSAGNAGPGDMSITTPHNINTNLVNTFTVGALDGDDPNLIIANFSSRGPSHCGGTNSILIKPEVSAPGVGVRSSVFNGGYGLKSGTSMAAPHVCGAIMLLKEAFPNLTGTDLKLALYNSCTDLGVAGEDNTYGMGIIDVFEAYNYLIDNGEVPVSPFVNNDVVLFDADVDPYVCDGSLNPRIQFENAGTSELTSFDIFYEVSGGELLTDNIAWTGSLAPGEQIEFDIPTIINIPEGSTNIKITILNPNGIPDERPLNNTYQSSLISPEVFEFIAGPEQVDQSATCYGSSAALRAEFEGDGIIEWYNQENGGALLGEGDVFVMDSLISDTMVYADVRIQEDLGLSNPDPDELEYSGDFSRALVFDAYYPFKLKSVKIFAEATGIANVHLRYSGGAGIVSKTVFISQPGERTIELDFNVPAGNDIELGMANGVALKYTTGSVNYPFGVDGVLDIKGTNDDDPLENYYFYYNWEIEFYRHCGRIPVAVDAISSAEIPEAIFEASDYEIDIDLDGEIEFTDLSTDAVEWYWSFGDGASSSAQNPIHTYADTGMMLVSLTVANEMGCTDSVVDTIQISGTIVDVEEIGIDPFSVRLYPNPVNNQLTIDFDMDRSAEIEILIFDVVGRGMMIIPKKNYSKEKLQVDMNHLDAGIYFVTFRERNVQWVEKVIKS